MALAKAVASSFAILSAFLLPACGDKGAIALSVEIREPSLNVESAALGTKLSGGFQLILSLGGEASGPTQVTPGTFALRNAAGTPAPSLAMTLDQSPPIAVPVGSSKTVNATIDASKLLDASAHDALCGGNLWFSAALSDTLGGRVTDARSLEFLPVCP
ncbi:MAG: hypothetical protein QM756_41080 [Polyangiaceae bacterium]